MNAREQFLQLIEQLTYLDHEYDKDVASELTEVIGHAKLEGLSANEIVELVEDRIALLKRSHVLEHDDQIEVVNELLEHLPDALDA